MKMKRAFTVLGFAALSAASLPTARAGALVCIGISAQAIYRNGGYDHMVHLVNQCPGDAVCDVSTNVNPEPTRVTVPKNDSVDILTFRGSPASVFTPTVSCRSAS
jgi:hypothetical protein